MIEKELNIIPLLIIDSELKKFSNKKINIVKLNIFLKYLISKKIKIQDMLDRPNNKSHFILPEIIKFISCNGIRPF